MRLRRILRKVWKVQRLSLAPRGRIRGRVLLSYLVSPFLADSSEDLPRCHSGHWECWEMGQSFLRRGFVLDAINHDDKGGLPRKDYSVFIDIHGNMERFAPLLPPGCSKVLHITGAHWLFQNTAEYQRLLELRDRRGITLLPRRQVPSSMGIEHADCATILGNDFTLGTFRFAGKPLHRIPTSTAMEFPWFAEKDFAVCRKRFLWLGSSGLVHKGLDLVLEAFAGMPEYRLTVCGPVQRERDFAVAFRRELYETHNIRTLDWVDQDGDRFREILRTNGAVIFPSCSEGASGSLVTCLHGGLIPVASIQSGVDIEKAGFQLKDCSIEEIRRLVRTVAQLPPEEVCRRSRAAWEFARTSHTRRNFSEHYDRFVGKVLGLDG